ncbi:hypothetical protein EDB87DRAFT_1584499 [Lactarius vividus]|nr:hypothetical protein EDB87DRAFT_1584499 [Lactarius vividus]
MDSAKKKTPVRSYLLMISLTFAKGALQQTRINPKNVSIPRLGLAHKNIRKRRRSPSTHHCLRPPRKRRGSAKQSSRKMMLSTLSN